MLVHGQRSGADDDGVGALDAKRFDLDAAARRLHVAEQNRPWLWREILKTAQHGVDVALQRLGEQGMKCRRRRRR